MRPWTAAVLVWSFGSVLAALAQAPTTLTMAVGGISSFEDVNSILAAGRADLCVLARAHLYDPYWTRHAAQELGRPLPWPSPYHTIDNYKPRFA